MLTKKIAKYIQSLNHKKFRDEERAFIAEGPKVVEEFLASEIFAPQIICAKKDWLLKNENITRKLPEEDVHEISDHDLSRVSQLKTANTVVAVFKKKSLLSIPVVSGKLSLLLDDLQDPGNMGTIIRIADWFGVKNIICSENTVDCFNPKVVQATMGSLARVDILYTEVVGFVEANDSIPVYAAVFEGNSIYDLAPVREGILAIGNESRGISPELLNLCKHKITIPRFGHAESLNAAVATGIILSHMK